MAQSRQEKLNKILRLASKSADSLCEFYKDENSHIWPYLNEESKKPPGCFEHYLRSDMEEAFVNGLTKETLVSLLRVGKWNHIFARCFIGFILRYPQLIDHQDKDKFITESFRMHALTLENLQKLANAETLYGSHGLAHHLLLPEIIFNYFRSVDEQKALIEPLFDLYFETLFKHSSESFLKQALARLLEIESWNSIFASNFMRFIQTHRTLFDEEDILKISRKQVHARFSGSTEVEHFLLAEGGETISDETKGTTTGTKAEIAKKQRMALAIIASLTGDTATVKGYLYLGLMGHTIRQGVSSIEDVIKALNDAKYPLESVQADFAKLMAPDAPLMRELSNYIENTTGQKKAAALAERGELYYQYAFLSGDPKHLKQAFEDFRDATLADTTPNAHALKRILEINQDIQQHFAPSSASTAKTKPKETFLSLDDESESESTLSDERERKTTLPIGSYQYQRATQIPGSEPYLKAIAPVVKAIQILHKGIENEDEAIAKKQQEEAKTQHETKRTPGDSKRQEKNIRDIVRAEAALPILTAPISASTSYTDKAAHNAWHYLWMWHRKDKKHPLSDKFEWAFRDYHGIGLKDQCIPPEYLFYFTSINGVAHSVIKYMFDGYLRETTEAAALVSRILETETAIRPYVESSKEEFEDVLLKECWDALIEQLRSVINIEKRLTLLDKAKEQLLDNINRINDKDLKKTIYADFHRQYERALNRTEQDRAKIHPPVGSKISIDDIRKYLENDIQRTKAKIGFETFNTHWYRDRKAVAKLTTKLSLLEDLKRKIDGSEFITTLDLYAKQTNGVTAKRLRQYHTDLTRHAPSPKPSRSVESKRG